VPPRANSPSSAEPSRAEHAFHSARPGDVIAGFLLERLIGRGETGAVFEATQLSLGRSIALRLIDPAYYADDDDRARCDRELRQASALHHPGLVPLFEAGEWTGGRYVAMRLIRGTNLGSHPASGPEAAAMLEPVAAGLEDAHRAGLSHGAVRAENVLVDGKGRAYLADMGLGRGAGPAADREGLVALRAALGSSAPTRRPRKALAAASVVGAILILAVAVLALRSNSGEEGTFADQPPPTGPEGTVGLGSDLASGPAGEVGCGARFGGASSCTLVLADSGGAPARATDDGAIRSWAVRGATGELTLQVLRLMGPRPIIAGFSQPVEAPDRGPHRFTTDIELRRGDLIAVKLGPGAALGSRAGDGGALRWEGLEVPLPELADATPVTGDLLVRVDVEPGGTPSAPAQLVGDEARVAPAGATLAETIVALSPRLAMQVRLVQVGDRIQLDVFSGSRRAARLPLGDTVPGGELLRFEQNCGPPRTICMRWLNPGEATPLVHAFRVTRSGRIQVIG
jgi:hypothetical protein